MNVCTNSLHIRYRFYYLCYNIQKQVSLCNIKGQSKIKFYMNFEEKDKKRDRTYTCFDLVSACELDLTEGESC